MADKGEETSCIHKNNFDQRPELAKKGKKENPQTVKTQKRNLFKGRIV